MGSGDLKMRHFFLVTQEESEVINAPPPENASATVHSARKPSAAEAGNKIIETLCKELDAAQ